MTVHKGQSSNKLLKIIGLRKDRIRVFYFILLNNTIVNSYVNINTIFMSKST